MELGEDVSVDSIGDEKHDEDCYFCTSNKPPDPVENDLTAHYDWDTDLDGSLKEGAFHNDARALGVSIGGSQGARALDGLQNVKAEKGILKASAAAHHLIPGNAALRRSKLFRSEKYLWKDGKVEGNIGYNVNAAPNGIWLPGNYWARPWGTRGAAFKSAFGPGPTEYAFAAIDAWHAQFHDSHELYSAFVRDTLDKIFDKLENNRELWCLKAKETDPDPKKRSPLFVIVSRLNTVSSRMSTMLRAPSTNWKKNIYTSTFSLLYMQRRTEHILAAVT